MLSSTCFQQHNQLKHRDFCVQSPEKFCGKLEFCNICYLNFQPITAIKTMIDSVSWEFIISCVPSVKYKAASFHCDHQTLTAAW